LLTSREIEGENFVDENKSGWYSQEALQTWRQLWTEYQDDALIGMPSQEPLMKPQNGYYLERNIREIIEGIGAEIDDGDFITKDQAATAMLRFINDYNSEINEQLKAVNTELAEMLDNVMERGLIYWEPQTERGAVAKAEMIEKARTVITKARQVQQPVRQPSVPEPERDIDLEPDL